MNFLPININIDGRRLLIIGAGRVGLHKATILSRYTSEATIIAPHFADGFDALPFKRIEKAYAAADLDGADIVYICTEDHALNRRIKDDCAARRILASVCDCPELCDFTSPAIFRDGDITVAVASNARDVRQSIALRNAIGDNYERLKAAAHMDRGIYGKTKE